MSYENRTGSRQALQRVRQAKCPTIDLNVLEKLLTAHSLSNCYLRFWA
jgi:hypothetical protein